MAGQGSARVTLREIDLSQVKNPQELPQGVPAAVVGPARKGPAFVPQTFANMQQFNETFGSMIENSRESNSNLFGPLALNEWMRNSKAGTYLRVLGVGNGKKSIGSGKVTDAGFVVGSKQVQEQSSGTGKIGDNKHAAIAVDVAGEQAETQSAQAVTNARTHFLGCFMKDAPGSQFLTDSGIQQETVGASLKKAFKLNTAADGNIAQIFLPKNVVNAGSPAAAVNQDITLTFKFLNAFTGDVANVAKDTIEVKVGAGDASIVDKLVTLLNTDQGIGGSTSNENFQYKELSVNLSEVFTAIETVGDTEAVTITLPVTREGEEAFIKQTVGNQTLLEAATNVAVNFTGASEAVPVIRGVLMLPQGVVPALEPASALNSHFTGMSEASDSQVRSEVNEKDFGQDPAVNLIGYVVGEVGESQDFKLILNGFSNTQKPAVLSCSFDPDSPSYISKVLNTDPTKIEECGHYLYAHWDVKPSVAVPANDTLEHTNTKFSSEGSDYAKMIGFVVAGAGGRNTSATNKPNYENFESRFKTAKTPWIVSQFFASSGDSSARPSSESAGQAYKLFKLHSLDDGEVSNTQYRLLIENVRHGGFNQFGSFDMSLESYDSDPVKGQPILSWKNLSLDANDRNFVGRVIGDKHMYFDFDRDEEKQRLVESGQYSQKNKFVRIELSDDLLSGEVPVEAIPTGFQGHDYLRTKANGNFVEPTAIAVANRVFTNAAGDGVAEILSQAQTPPLDFVTSINRVVAGSLEADTDLAWGVKFSLRESQHNNYTDVNGDLVKGHRELVEQVFNTSVSSWAKFWPALDGNPALVSGDDVGSYQNSMFSLEKILIPSTSLTDDEITTWDGALYKRQGEAAPSGARYVNMTKDALGGNVRYLKFRCMFQGGFDGVNIFDAEKSSFSGIASLREGLDETNSSKFTGPTVMSYRKAVDVLSDKSAAEFQLLALPGQRSSSVTDFAISACEERFDAMYVMDIVKKDAGGAVIEDDLIRPGVRHTIKEFSNRSLNTSFAAAYFPDVLMRRPSDRAPIVVPPSVGMLGVMSRNDSIADPWFAPAGLSRGRLSAIDSNVNMTRDLLDELYDADINPIYVPAGRSGEVYAFGQKTLLQEQSALDRINVRRLLIDIRRKVRKVGEQLLFEPNRESTLQRFTDLVEPIMSNVQQRRGVTRYKVQIDTTTTTQNDIENNTIRGKIYLQPTKSVEFISLDFVVANTIQD